MILVAEKYPGTEKGYSSFKSKVSVIDETNFDYEIYMNHILNYKDIDFFQASFDPDERGTVLSVEPRLLRQSVNVCRLYFTI